MKVIIILVIVRYLQEVNMHLMPWFDINGASAENEKIRQVAV